MPENLPTCPGMAAPLLLLCGPAFSGKTTLADHLARAWRFRVVSLDEINARRGLWGGEGVPEAEWARTASIARAQARELLADPASRVVVDDTFCFRFLRRDFAALAGEVGRSSRLLLLATPVDELRRRIAENEKAPGRRGIRGDVLERHLASFEWPGDDEPHVGVSDASALDRWLAHEAPTW